MTFLLDEPSDRQHDGRLGRSDAPARVQAGFDPVMDEPHRSVATAQLLEVTLTLRGAGEHDRRVAHLARELAIRGEPDVLSVCRQSVRKPGHPACEARDRCRLVREMDIDRRRPETHEPVGQDDAAAQVRSREVRRCDRIREPIEVCLGPPERERSMRGTRGEPRRRVGEIGEVLDLGLKTVERFLTDGLFRTAKRDHVQPQSLLLELQELVQHEGLRKPRKTVQHNGEIDSPIGP